ncbi:phosphatase and actin regulator 2 [Trichonephila clavipes]|nr:phosphatase and actin regulator 2 [Trichonephila clavipes]
MVEVKPINISLNQHSPGLSVRTAISPTLTEEFIIHPSVYAEIKKLGHAKSDVLLNESESSLGAYAYPSVVSVSILCKKVKGAMKTSSVNFNNPSPMESKHRRFAMLRRIFEPWQWKRRKKRDRFEQTSRTLERKISMRSTKELIKKGVLMPVKHNFLSVPSFLYVSDSPLVSMKKEKKGIRTAADSGQSGWPVMASKKSSRSHHLATQSSRAGAVN